MRFRSTTSVKPTRSPIIGRWRLWMLVVALGLVLVVIRQLDQPATIHRLDQLFDVGKQARLESESEQVPTEMKPTENNTHSLSVSIPPEQYDESAVALEREGVDLSAVRDKTFFRPKERPAWFALLGQLQQWDETQLAKQTVGELTYAQLLKQPDVYRGRVVTLHGTVLREKLQQLKDNPLGLTEYHQLWIQPRGGGQWPFVVYCLRLPSGFPRGEAIHADIRVHGFFFKNWSYAWEEGLGLAPVVLANQPEWQPPTPRAARQPRSWQAWVAAIAVACVVAAGVSWFALSRTRRRKIRPVDDESVRQRISQLTEEDSA